MTEVDPGKPMRVFRRYWQPVATLEQATTRPKKVHVPGEDLILFRDRKGRPELLYPRCMHRGTTLFYGKGRHAFVSDRSRGGTLLWRKRSGL
jgi:phenylpropionate dioxygenase-like ring-hydroxylating dioxygenase large terminal subunit